MHSLVSVAICIDTHVGVGGLVHIYCVRTCENLASFYTAYGTKPNITNIIGQFRRSCAALAPDPWPAPAVGALYLENTGAHRRSRGRGVCPWIRGHVASYRPCVVRACVRTCVNSAPTTTTNRQIDKSILALITDSNRIRV